MGKIIDRVRRHWRAGLNIGLAAFLLVGLYAAYKNAQRCAKGDGCITVTRKQYIESIKDSVDAGWEAAKEGCR
jgi:hypothetical protein